MKNQPFFSIVIPTYNRQNLICKAISSVVEQTYQNWELIICDDCSTDDTVQMIREKYKVSNINVFTTKINGGNAAARNLGVKYAKGDYICFLDSDDRFHSNYLQEISKLIIKYHEPGFIWCNVNHISIDGKITPNKFPDHWKPLEQENKYEYMLQGLYFGTGFGLAVRSDVFKNVGLFDERLRVAVDTDFSLRLVRETNFTYTDSVLVDVFDHKGTRVRKGLAEKIKAYEIMLEKHPVIFSNRILSLKWFYKLMWMNYQNKNKNEARKYFKLIKSPNNKVRTMAILYEILPVKLAIKIHTSISNL